MCQGSGGNGPGLLVDWVSWQAREEGRSNLSALGIKVDTIDWELQIGAQRLAMVMEKLLTWKDRSRASKRDIASLHRHLSFIARVAKPGRILLR